MTGPIPPAVTGSADAAFTDSADGAIAGAGAVSARGAVAARAGGGPVRILFPRPGAVIVARSAARAHRLRLAATLLVSRRVGGLGLRLNGHPLHLPARTGRVRVLLDAADGLVLGENRLWVTVGGRDGHPVVPFVVGDRDTRALAVHLRLEPGALSAATLGLRVPLNAIDSISVTLNGARVRVPSDGGATGRIVLDLPEVGPVHWGANHVAVRLIMLDGRIDHWARTFGLDPRRDIAIARVHGPAVVGRTVSLAASRSLIVPGQHPDHRVCWVLLRRPRLSHARLARAHGARITLRLDVPGYYQVALLVGRVSRPRGREAVAAQTGSQGGYDVATVAARDDEPLVPLSTMAPGSGVMVGGDFYARHGTGQLVVLDRSTLELLDNRTFNESDFNPYPYEPRPFVHSPMYDYVASLPSTDLVIFTWQGGLTNYNGNTLVSFRSTVNLIGGSVPAKSTLSTPHCWSGATDQCGNNLPVNTTPPASWQISYTFPSFSVIGVPGLQVGQAWRETASQNGGNGAIVGYLTRGNTGGTTPEQSDYTVINGGTDAYEAVNTCAGANCDVQIGYPADPQLGLPADAHFASYPSPGPNGLHIVAVDRTSLAPILNRTVTTASDLLSALTAAGVQQQVGTFVGSMDDQRLVIIQTVGNGYVSGLGGAGVAPLFQYVDELGGTPDLLAEAMTGYYNYALVGAATNLPWRNASALESSTEIPGTPPSNPNTPGGASVQTGHISGVLQRDPTGLYTPLSGDPVGTTNSELDRILYQPAQPWPYADDTHDLKDIADDLGLSDYPDIRSAYYENTNVDWDVLYSQVKDPSYVPCPQGDECGPDSTFEHLTTELQAEFQWVGRVLRFGNNLLSPYEQYKGYIHQDVVNVTGTVSASKPVPPAAKVKFDWLSAAANLMYLASSALALSPEQGVSSAVFGLLGGAGGLATQVMETQTQDNGAPAPADTLSTTASDLENRLLDQVQAYEFWVQATMETIVLRDYGKLKEVGTALPTSAWAWSTQATPYAVKALRGNTRASAYSALIPVVWPGYNLKLDDLYGGGPGGSTDPGITCDSNKSSGTGNNHNYPFASATQANQFYWTPRRPAGTPQPQFRALTTLDNNGGVYQAWVFAQLNGNATPVKTTAPWSTTLPAPDLTHYIYGKDSTNGDNGAYQFAPVWWRDTYNPPSYTQCYRVASGNSSFNYNSTAYPPPNIPRPLP